MSENIITLKDIVVEFDGERILDKINLEIKDKEFVTFLGPSGCGKTTTLVSSADSLNPTAAMLCSTVSALTAFRPINATSIRFSSVMRFSLT